MRDATIQASPSMLKHLSSIMSGTYKRVGGWKGVGWVVGSWGWIIPSTGTQAVVLSSTSDKNRHNP